MVSKDLWQEYKERQCGDIKRDRVLWLRWAERRSDHRQLWPGHRLSSFSTMQRLAETSNQANRGFIVMHAVSHPPARPLSERKTITSH